jgi:hypothetical protein
VKHKLLLHQQHRPAFAAKMLRFSVVAFRLENLKKMGLEAAAALFVTSGSATTAAAAAGVFGANASKRGLFSSLSQLFGGLFALMLR